MTNNTGIQVADKEVEMAGMVAAIAQFLQDATQLPTLRKQLEAAMAECESLKRAKADLEVEIQLEKEERARFANISNTQEKEIYNLKQRVQSLQHKFDTINGVVMAAMAEIERDKPKGEFKPSYGVEVKQEEPKPWTPSLPEPNRSSHYS